MIEKLKLCLFLAILALISGCSASHNTLSPQETATLEISQLGDLLDVTFLRGPDINSSQNVSLVIKNLSDYCMVFPYDFGIKLWVEVNGDWEDIDNMVQYRPEEDIYLEPAGDLFSVMGVSLFPDLSNFPLPEKTNFKAMLIGHLCDDATVVIEKDIFFTVSP